MPTFLNKAAESDKEIRGTQEKDPADLTGAHEPDWDNPASWGGGDETASKTAGDSDSEKTPKSARSPRHPPRRRGRPRGPERAALSVRILAKHDRMLTAAVEATGDNPQTIVDEALAGYFRRHKIEDPEPNR